MDTASVLGLEGHQWVVLITGGGLVTSVAILIWAIRTGRVTLGKSNEETRDDGDSINRKKR